MRTRASEMVKGRPPAWVQSIREASGPAPMMETSLFIVIRPIITYSPVVRRMTSPSPQPA